MMSSKRAAGLGLMLVAAGAIAAADVCNLKVVTDASPDYYDLPSLVHSVTSKWATPEEKCWAMFYWVHIARRQTTPMKLHGLALADPIRQFNDYGFTMCSTVSGINQAIWEAMGLKHKYWDITRHTVSEVEYGGKWHCYDNSLSALYTLCDGKTIAGVADIGKDGACAASGGKTEPGHIAKYHCLTATSPNGFLIGADCMRSLTEEYGCFTPKYLKYRYYYYDWDSGHRYILNLKENEVYTRYYHRLDKDKGEVTKRNHRCHPAYYTPNPGIRDKSKDPEWENPRYRIRANGTWSFRPDLGARGWKAALHDSENVTAARGGGLAPTKAGAVGSAVFKVQSANVVTSQEIRAVFGRKGNGDLASMLISTDNGLHWKEIWKAGATGDVRAGVKLVEEVNGAYEVLVKAVMKGERSASAVTLRSLEIDTVTQVNSKTLPKFNVGKNVVYVSTGDQTDSIVYWPELQGGRYKQHVVEEKNIGCLDKHMGYRGVIFPTVAKEDAYVVYRMDAPRDITSITYGGRYFNRAAGSRIDTLHSFDGKNWTKSYSLTDTSSPWDVIHYETVNIPRGHRQVWVKYLMNSTGNTQGATSIYAVRMEANHLPLSAGFEPVEVTFKWKERGADRSLVERSHTQLVTKVPFRYTVNVGGADHPVMESLRVNLKGAVDDVRYGYSDGNDPGGRKFTDRWVTYGKNMAVGKKYKLSVPSMTNWGAGDPDGTKLADGVVGPPFSGGNSYKYGAIWGSGTNPVIDLDLGDEVSCASFGLNCHGYPGWDALKGEVKDRIEVLVSGDGKSFKPLGELKTSVLWREVPINHMIPDDEHLRGVTHRLILEKPVRARHVRFKIANKRFFDVTEIEVLDSIRFEPFDIRIALPDEK